MIGSRATRLASIALSGALLGAHSGAPAPGGSGSIGVQIDEEGGRVRVAAVVPGAPADRAGVRAGDVLLRVDGTPVAHANEAVDRIRAHPVGSRTHVDLERGGRPFAVDLTLATRDHPPSVGDPAPMLHAAVAWGQGPADLDALRGHVVLLDFWATWCGPCRASMPALDDLARRHAASGVAVIGVTDEPAGRARAVGMQSRLSYTLASDPTAAARFGVSALPTLMVVDRRGVVRYVTSGFSRDEAARVEGWIRRLLAERP